MLLDDNSAASEPLVYARKASLTATPGLPATFVRDVAPVRGRPITLSRKVPPCWPPGVYTAPSPSVLQPMAPLPAQPLPVAPPPHIPQPGPPPPRVPQPRPPPQPTFANADDDYADPAATARHCPTVADLANRQAGQVYFCFVCGFNASHSAQRCPTIASSSHFNGGSNGGGNGGGGRNGSGHNGGSPPPPQQQRQQRQQRHRQRQR